MRRTLGVLLIVLLAALLLLTLCERDAGTPESTPSPRNAEAVEEPEPARVRERARVRPSESAAAAGDDAAESGADTSVEAEQKGTTIVVQDATGNPLAGAVVRLGISPLSSGAPLLDPQFVAPRTTDARGRVHYPGLDRRRTHFLEVVATKDDWVGAAVGWETRPKTGPHEIVVRAVEGTWLRGRVLKPDGAPAPGAEVTIRHLRVWTATQSIRTFAGSNGEFRLGPVPPDAVWGVPVVRASHSGSRRGAAHAFDATDVVVRLETVRTISGVVVDDEDEPVSGAWVHSENEREVMTQRDGSFVVTRRPTDGNAVFVSAEGYETVHAVASLDDSGEPAPVRVVMAAEAPLRGRVVSASGAPASPTRTGFDPNAEPRLGAIRSKVTLRPPGGSATLAESAVAADGTFTLPAGGGRWDVALVPPAIEVHGHFALLRGRALGVTTSDEVVMVATEAPHARVLVKTEPPLDQASAHKGSVRVLHHGATPTWNEPSIHTTLLGGAGRLHITRPTGRCRVLIDFGAAGRWSGDIEVPTEGVSEYRAVLAPSE